MKFKSTFALALVLGMIAVGGSGQNAAASEKYNPVLAVAERVQKAGRELLDKIRWLDRNPHETGTVVTKKEAGQEKHPQRLTLVQRLTGFNRPTPQKQTFKSGDSVAVHATTGKRPDEMKVRFGYQVMPKLRELRKALFENRYARKQQRPARITDDRRARLQPKPPVRKKQTRMLNPAEETRLAARLAHGDVDEFRRTALAARMGPERKKVSWLSRTLASFRIQKPVTSDRKYGLIVERYARAYGVPVELAHAVIKVESNYRPNVRGRAGEVGLMQIKPATARMMGYSGSVKDLYHPENNIKYGMLYLAKAHKLGGGTTCGTILKYNAGHAARRMNPISARYCAKVKRHLRGI